VHKLINIPSINPHLNKLDSVFSFTEEKEMEKEMGGGWGEMMGKKSEPPSDSDEICHKA